MPERGGPATQSGILYQNTMAAIFLGHLCSAQSQPPARRVQEVRGEAPDHVDDIAVTYADGHRDWIQAKEDVRRGEAAWTALWQDFERQFWQGRCRPGRDRLVLYAGEFREELHLLRELGERARGHADPRPWLAGLGQRHGLLLTSLRALMSPEHRSDRAAHLLLRHVWVEIAPLDALELRAVQLMPPGNCPAPVLFRVLRDRVGRGARFRQAFQRDDLIKTLRDEDGVCLGDAAPQAEAGGRRQEAERRPRGAPPISAAASEIGRRRFTRDVVRCSAGSAFLFGLITVLLARSHTNVFGVLFSTLMAIGSAGLLAQVGVIQAKRWADRKLNEKYNI